MAKKPKKPVPDYTYHYVIPDQTLGFALGQFVVAWGDVEQQLDKAFHILFHTDPNLAFCIYANLGTKVKIEMLQSAISMQEKAIGKGLTKYAHRILKRVAQMSSEVRLITAHGQAAAYIIDGKGPTRYQLIRNIARAKPKITVHPTNVSFWRGQTNRARDLCAAWRYCVARIYSMIDGLSSDDIYEMCVIDTQVVRSPYSRHHKRPLRRKHALEDHQSKLPKWPRS